MYKCSLCVSSCLSQQRAVLSHGWKLTGGEVSECVSMKYSSLLLQFLLVHLLVLMTNSHPLNTRHVQQQIHETVLVPNNREHGSQSTESLGPLHWDWGPTEAVGSPSVEVVALTLSLYIKEKTLRVSSTGWIIYLSSHILKHAPSLSHPTCPNNATTQRVRVAFQVIHVALSLWFWGQVLNLLVRTLLLHYLSMRDSVTALLKLMPPPSPPWRSSWVRLGSGCWRSGSRERGRSDRSPTPQSDTPEEKTHREKEGLMLWL